MGSNYGVTDFGFVQKRMDEIYRSMHRKLSEAWGVNTMENPQSYLNVLITTIADELAQNWEADQEVYHSFYPSGAEGISLDLSLIHI